MTLDFELQATPTHLHGSGSEGFHDPSASEELLRVCFHDKRARPCSSIERQQRKEEIMVSRRIMEVKVLKLENSDCGFEEGIGDGRRGEEVICVGIVEGGAPCFVYSRKA